MKQDTWRNPKTCPLHQILVAAWVLRISKFNYVWSISR